MFCECVHLSVTIQHPVHNLEFSSSSRFVNTSLNNFIISVFYMSDSNCFSEGGIAGIYQINNCYNYCTVTNGSFSITTQFWMMYVEWFHNTLLSWGPGLISQYTLVHNRLGDCYCINFK